MTDYLNANTATTPGAELSAAKLREVAEEIHTIALLDHITSKLIDVWGHDLDPTKVYIMRPKSEHIVMYLPRAKLHTLFHNMLAAGCRVRLEPRSNDG